MREIKVIALTVAAALFILGGEAVIKYANAENAVEFRKQDLTFDCAVNVNGDLEGCGIDAAEINRGTIPASSMDSSSVTLLGATIDAVEISSVNAESVNFGTFGADATDGFFVFTSSLTIGNVNIWPAISTTTLLESACPPQYQMCVVPISSSEVARDVAISTFPNAQSWLSLRNSTFFQ